MLDPKLVSSIHLLFFQVKHSGGMKPTEIEKWLQTVDDFFDLSKDPNSFGDRYNARIKSAMRVWRDQYLKLSGQFPAVLIDFYYITGDDASPDTYATDACDRVKRRVEKALKPWRIFSFQTERRLKQSGSSVAVAAAGPASSRCIVEC